LNIIFQDKAGNKVTVTAVADIHVSVDALPFADAPASEQTTKTTWVWFKPWTWV
jgi:hypothetical protein